MLLLEDIFKIGMILLLIGIIIACCFKVKSSKLFLYSMIYIYIVLVLGITLCPIPYGEIGHIFPATHNFVPFRTISSTLEGGITFTAVLQIGGNILISVPYGVYLCIELSKHKHKGMFLYLLPLLFPIVVECLQFVIGLAVGVVYRSFDIDDFILNAGGAYLGVIFSKLFFKFFSKNSLLGFKSSN